MKTILLIEDNDMIQDNIKEILELAGYVVLTADDGKSGIKIAIEQKPDLIISDINMPELDGYGVLHLIQKRPEFLNTPFIFLTGKVDRDEFRKGMEMGADDYITKPFTDTEILNAVESRLAKAERIKAVASGAGQSDLSLKYDYKQALEELKANARLNVYKNKQIIFREGNFPQHLYYIKSGKITAVKYNEEGKELTVGLYSPGDFIGYIALLENSEYKITARAIETTELLLISREEFMEQIKNNSAFAHQFTKVLVEKNNYKAEQMVQLAYNSLRKRVANTLILLKTKFSTEQDDKASIKMTREELANLSGTTTESLIRTLSDFKGEGLIDIQGRTIKILDENRLINMFN